MMTPIHIISTTAHARLPEEFHLNGFLAICFQIIHRIHKVWFWFQKINTYTNPDNFLKLAGGHVLNWVAGNRLIVRIAAHSVLIAARVNDHVKEQIALVKEFQSLWHIASDKYALSKKIKWEAKGGWCSPSTKVWLKVKSRQIKDKLRRLFKALISIFKHLFLLSMKTMDAVSAFSYDKETQDAGLNELFVNSGKCLDSLIKNKDMLLNCLRKNKEMIAQLLLGASSIFTVDQLIAVVEKGVGVTEQVHRGIENASQAVGVVGKDLMQRAIFGLFQAAGLVDLMPDAWVPPIHPPWMDRIRVENNTDKGVNKAQFPPKHAVTLYSSWSEVIDNEAVLEIAKMQCICARQNYSYREKDKKLIVDKVRKKYSHLL